MYIKCTVDGWATNSLWPRHKATLRDCLVKVKFTSAGGYQIPTFGSQAQEMEFSGQLFSHTFVNATVKTPILGRDFLKANDPVENYRCCYLTQTDTCLVIKSVDANPANNTNMNNVSISPSWPAFLENFLTSPTHPATPRSAPASAQPRQAPVRRQEKGGRTEVQGHVSSRHCLQERGPWAAPLHLVKKQDGGWLPFEDFCGLNLKTIADSYVVPNLHGLNFNLKDKQVFLD